MNNPTKPQKLKCTALTAKGEPCKAWAIHDSVPPRCAPHSGITGAPKGNDNAVTHGYYQNRVKPEELNSLYEAAAGADLNQETLLLRVLLHRLSAYLIDPDLPLEKVNSIAPTIVSASRALAYIQNHLPDPNALDWDAILDEVGAQLDWDLSGPN